jgi:hypothetical protein
MALSSLVDCGMVWYGAPPTPCTAIVATRRWQLDAWIGHRLSMLRLSPLRPRLFGDGFHFHRDFQDIPRNI